jgi:hypothetical protein
MGLRRLVLRPRCFGPGRARTQIPFIHPYAHFNMRVVEVWLNTKLTVCGVWYHVVWYIGTDIFEICILAVLVSLTDTCLKLSSRSRCVCALAVKDIILQMHSDDFCVLCNLLGIFCFSLRGISKVLSSCLPACLVLYTVHYTVQTSMYSTVVLTVNYPTWQ